MYRTWSGWGVRAAARKAPSRSYRPSRRLWGAAQGAGDGAEGARILMRAQATGKYRCRLPRMISPHTRRLGPGGEPLVGEGDVGRLGSQGPRVGQARSANSASKGAWLHRAAPTTAPARRSGGPRTRQSGPTARRGAGWQAAPACECGGGVGADTSAPRGVARPDGGAPRRAPRPIHLRVRTARPSTHSLTTGRDHARIDACYAGSQAVEGAGGRGRGRER